MASEAARGGDNMRFRDVSRRTANQLGVDGPTVEYIVEGFLRVSMQLLADGHSIPTVLGTLRTKKTDARLRRSRGWRRDVKIVTSREARSALDRLTPTRLAVRARNPRPGSRIAPPRFSPPRIFVPKTRP